VVVGRGERRLRSGDPVAVVVAVAVVVVVVGARSP
jgi:hypothetical protein